MKVEIWSDVMCPFCYIGKRKFEAALDKFKNKENVEIVWKSFQLNPNLVTDPSKNTIQHLAETKGWTMDYTRNTIAYVTNMAKEVGLNYDFDKAVVANSFDAHRLIQMAKKHNKGDAAEERLFKAYFTEGKNTADHATLIALGKEIGLNETEVKTMLAGKEFSNEVLKDLSEAEQLRISGVPFFVFDRKYAVSGAQDSQVFADTMAKAWEDYAKTHALVIDKEGKVCTPDGQCK
ncbi:MAG: DsbA family oxidoreductase [Bacteroidia bacterium]|nr:DsbA family oxidoreductase [Bacteroidia bacterium]